MNKIRFAKRIVELREALGLKREKLAQNLNISYGHLNNIELGKRMPSLEIMIRLASELHVPSGYLVQLLDDENPLQKFIDPDLYLAFPPNLSQEDKTEIREYVVFKERRRNPVMSISFENESLDTTKVVAPQNRGYYLAG